MQQGAANKNDSNKHEPKTYTNRITKIRLHFKS